MKKKMGNVKIEKTSYLWGVKVRNIGDSSNGYKVDISDIGDIELYTKDYYKAYNILRKMYGRYVEIYFIKTIRRQYSMNKGLFIKMCEMYGEVNVYE